MGVVREKILQVSKHENQKRIFPKSGQNQRSYWSDFAVFETSNGFDNSVIRIRTIRNKDAHSLTMIFPSGLFLWQTFIWTIFGKDPPVHESTTIRPVGLRESKEALTLANGGFFPTTTVSRNGNLVENN
jgi:hypothetical protein